MTLLGQILAMTFLGLAYSNLVIASPKLRAEGVAAEGRGNLSALS